VGSIAGENVMEFHPLQLRSLINTSMIKGSAGGFRFFHEGIDFKRTKFAQGIHEWVHPNPSRGQYAIFQNTLIGGDKTGTIVMTRSIELQGKQALRLEGVNAFVVLEQSVPLSIGRGELIVGPKSVLSLGLNGTISDHSMISVKKNGRLWIDHYCSIQVKGHYGLNIEKGGELLLDGELSMKSPIHLRICGDVWGSGKVESVDGVEYERCD